MMDSHLMLAITIFLQGKATGISKNKEEILICFSFSNTYFD